MEDVTEIVLQYRAILQNLWNSQFYPSRDDKDAELITKFKELTHLLFKFLVWDKVDRERPAADTLFGPNFKVVPSLKSDGLRRVIHSLTIDMQPLDTPGGLWEEVRGEFDADDLKLHLLDFFDWRLYYLREYRYFRVRIDGFKSYPDRVGRGAFVDVLDVSVFFEAPAPTERQSDNRYLRQYLPISFLEDSLAKGAPMGA